MLGVHARGLHRTHSVRGRLVHALDGADLDAPPGTLVAIVGYSGCGKTTLLRQIAGLDAPDAGTVAFRDGNGRPRPPGRIGMVFQEPRLLPWKTVRGNLVLATRRLPAGAAGPERIDAALRLVGLEAFAEARPAQLSGGMAQRVSLARALCREPELLLMDEPFGALDALTRAHLQGELARIRLARAITTLFVTHDVGEAVRLADTVAVMAAGRVVATVPVPLPHPRDAADPALAPIQGAVLATILDGRHRPFPVQPETDPMHPTRRHVLGAFAALGALSGLGRPARAATPREINVSYVKAPFNLQTIVTRRRELLEKEFAADGIAVRWHDITAGPQQAQAMAAGALDIGGVMNTASVLMANAGGNPVRIAAGVSRPSRTFAIVGKAGGPATVRDLKGRTVAGPKGTVLHQTLVAALAREGMAATDVEFVNMDLPKAQAALLAGHVDAALLAASLVIKSVAAGARVIATADGLVQPLLVMGVREAFAAENPGLLARVVAVHRQAQALIEADREGALALGAREQDISVEEARTLAEWANFTTTLAPSDLDAMAADVRFLLGHEMLKQPVEPKDLVLPLAFG